MVRTDAFQVPWRGVMKPTVDKQSLLLLFQGVIQYQLAKNVKSRISVQRN